MILNKSIPLPSWDGKIYPTTVSRRRPAPPHRATSASQPLRCALPYPMSRASRSRAQVQYLKRPSPSVRPSFPYPGDTSDAPTTSPAQCPLSQCRGIYPRRGLGVATRRKRVRVCVIERVRECRPHESRLIDSRLSRVQSLSSSKGFSVRFRFRFDGGDPRTKMGRSEDVSLLLQFLLSVTSFIVIRALKECDYGTYHKTAQWCVTIF